MASRHRSRTIYLVTGTSGSYEDTRQWNVRAFEVKAEADALAAALAEADELGRDRIRVAYERDADEHGSDFMDPTPRADRERERHIERMNRLDPDGVADCDERRYWVAPVQLVPARG
jgi:hypothetical protein